MSPPKRALLFVIKDAALVVSSGAEICEIPFPLSRTILLCMVSLYLLNSPPRTIFESGWIINECAFGEKLFVKSPVPVIKLGSLVPFSFN